MCPLGTIMIRRFSCTGNIHSSVFVSFLLCVRLSDGKRNTSSKIVVATALASYTLLALAFHLSVRTGAKNWPRGVSRKLCGAAAGCGGQLRVVGVKDERTERRTKLVCQIGSSQRVRSKNKLGTIFQEHFCGRVPGRRRWLQLCEAYASETQKISVLIGAILSAGASFSCWFFLLELDPGGSSGTVILQRSTESDL